MITSSGVSSSFILNNCAKWELLWSPFIGKEKESQEGESFERFQARSDLKACASLTLGRCLQLKPVLCLLILLHTPNTMLLLRKRIRIAPRGVSPAPPQDSAAPPLQRPRKAASGIATAALRERGVFGPTQKRFIFPQGSTTRHSSYLE